MPQRPLIAPALRQTWRSPTTLQIGTGEHGPAVVLEGVTGEWRRVLDSLDGSASPGRDKRSGSLLAGLDAAGVLDDASGAGGQRANVAAVRHPDAERAALTTLRAGAGVSSAVLRRRRSATVVVHGAGRVAESVAATLRQSGVGEVRVGAWELGDPRGGLVLPEAGCACVVLCPPGPVESALAAARLLTAARRPHLVASLREGIGLVGPLVLPGWTACQDCVVEERCSSDPDWRLVAGQLAQSAPSPADSADAATAAATGAVAARQVCSFVDLERDAERGWQPVPGQGSWPRAMVCPPSVGSVVEVRMVEGALVWTPVQRHPSCPCSELADGFMMEG